MPERYGQIRCQRCREANSLGQELCVKCGTRLMLIVEPSSLRFEEATSGGESPEHVHLLERVSILENQLGRIVERLEKSVGLMLRQARAAHLDHMLLETLIDALAEAGAVNPSKLRESWKELREKESEGRGLSERRHKLRTDVIGHGASDAASVTEFQKLIDEGFDLLARSEQRRALRALERAAALAPTNAPLNFALGEHFFRENRRALARDYLERAVAARGKSAAGEGGRARLMLGVVYGDEGDTGRAKELLQEAVAAAGPQGFAAPYALGRIFAAGGEWGEALAQFKIALRAKPEWAAAHYCVGLACHELGRERTARRHLSKAVELDANFAVAHVAFGHVLLELGEKRLAAQSFAAAGHVVGVGESKGKGRKNSVALKTGARKGRTKSALSAPPLHPFGLAPGSRKLLVTGGDARLAVALKEDVLGGGAGALTAAPRTL